MVHKRLRPFLLVLIGSILITMLMSFSALRAMRNMEAIGIYDFEPIDYLRRIILTFFVSAIFLYINVIFNQVKLGKLHFNLLRIGPIILFNLMVFIFLISFILLAMWNRLDAWHLEVGLDSVKPRLVVSVVATNWVIMISAVLIGTSYRFLRENFDIRLQNEKLNKESAETKLANLKEQLNPHFLFNSFSTLNELIDISADKAKVFVHHMSDLYRFVLRNEQVDKVILVEELEFAMNYYAMLKERFGESLHCHFIISEDVKQMKVPPISIQMLIENAIKHNFFDNEKPLHIYIQSFNAYIKVNNRINKRFVANSHQMGLYNLNQRYQLLSGQEIIINNDEDTFEVQIPLLP